MQQEDSKKTPDETFESDTQKIIRRHLENEDDQITDEDIRNVRVGVTPPQEEIHHYDETEEERSQEKETPITPWDTVDEDQ